MDFFKSSYCNLTRQLLSFVGLWPYQNSRKFLGYRVFLTIIFSASVCAQCMCLFTTEVTLDFLIDAVPTGVVPGGCVVIIWNRWVNFNTMKWLLEQMKNDWCNTNSPAESQILHRYLDLARRMNVIYSVYTCIGISSFILSTLTSQILDIILPLNESRPKAQPIKMELFIDQEQHFNIVLASIHAIIILVLIILLGNHNIFVLYIHHACGMFAVLTHRLEQVLYRKNGANADVALKEDAMIKRLGFCIADHSKVVELTNTIDGCYSKYFFVIITGSIVTFSLFLIDALTVSADIDRKMRSVCFVTGFFVYMFINSYMGQRLMDLSTNLSNVVYGGHWYETSITSQKTLILIMLRSIKPCSVSVGNFYTLSLAKFTMVAQTIVSYCMIVRQFQ